MSHTWIQPSVVAKEALRQLENNLVMGKLVFRGYEEEWMKNPNGWKIGANLTVKAPVYHDAPVGHAVTVEDVHDADGAARALHEGVGRLRLVRAGAKSQRGTGVFKERGFHVFRSTSNVAGGLRPWDMRSDGALGDYDHGGHSAVNVFKGVDDAHRRMARVIDLALGLVHEGCQDDRDSSTVLGGMTTGGHDD